MSVAETPKYMTISREIEALIRAGEWDGVKIPSARDLAGQHGVSLGTASRALQILQDKGLIRTKDRSGSYVTPVDPPPAPPDCWALCIRATPGPWYQASFSVTRAGFDVLTQSSEALRIDVDSLEFREFPTIEGLRHRIDLAIERGVSGVFLMPSRWSPETTCEDEAILGACRAAGLPVVLLERNLRGHGRPLECDLVAVDDQDGGLMLGGHLFEQGRTRVAFVTGSPTSSHDNRMAGYFLAGHRASIESGQAFEPMVFEEPQGLPRKAVFQALADQVIGRRVDGLVCYQDYTAVGMIIELLSRGVRVPSEVAITGFDDLPVGNSFSLGVTTYAYPSEAIAREAVRLMKRRIEEPDSPRLRVSLPGKLIIRESSVNS
jgi:LacI family transcriptional regulator